MIAGTVNGAGSLRVEVTGTGDRHRARRHHAAGRARRRRSRSRAQALADRAAFWLTIVAIGAAALITVVAWLLARRDCRVRHRAGRDRAGDRLPARARPRRAAGGRDLDDARRAQRPPRARPARPRGSAQRSTSVVFDKTGTLTRGEFGVVEIATVGGLDAGRGASPRRRGRARLRASDRAGIVRTRRGARLRRCPPTRLRSDPRAAACEATSTAATLRSAGPRLLRERCRPTAAAELRAATGGRARAGRRSICCATSSGARRASPSPTSIRPRIARGDRRAARARASRW